MDESSEDDLPSLGPSLGHMMGESGGRDEPYEAMSIEQLVSDKKEEVCLEEFQKELMNFKLTEEPSDEEDEVPNSQSSQAAAVKEPCIWGLRYIGVGALSLPEVIHPPELQVFVGDNPSPDLLILLQWGDVIREQFSSPKLYQAWLFTLMCYSQEEGVSRQASYLLTEELHSDRTGDVYTPTPQDMELVMSDYGATAKPEVVELTEPLKAPSHFENLILTVVMFARIAKRRSIDIDNAKTALKLIVRLSLDQHMTSSADHMSELSDAISNLLEGLGNFTTSVIEDIASSLVIEVPDVKLGPLLCQVLRLGSPRCCLISEHLSLLLLSRFSSAEPGSSLHQVILKLSSLKYLPEELIAVVTLLDYHLDHAVLNKDELSETHEAMYKLYNDVRERSDRRLERGRSSVLIGISKVFQRIQSNRSHVTVFD